MTEYVPLIFNESLVTTIEPLNGRETAVGAVQCCMIFFSLYNSFKLWRAITSLNMEQPPVMKWAMSIYVTMSLASVTFGLLAMLQIDSPSFVMYKGSECAFGACLWSSYLVLYGKQASFLGTSAGSMMPRHMQKKYNLLATTMKLGIVAGILTNLCLPLIPTTTVWVFSVTDTQQSIRVIYDFLVFYTAGLAAGDTIISINTIILFCVPLLVLSSKKDDTGHAIEKQRLRVRNAKLRAIAKTNLNWSLVAIVSTSLALTFGNSLVPEYTDVWILLGAADVVLKSFCIRNMFTAGRYKISPAGTTDFQTRGKAPNGDNTQDPLSETSSVLSPSERDI